MRTWDSDRSEGASRRRDGNNAGRREDSRSVLVAEVDRLFYVSVIAFAVYMIALMVG